MSAGLRGVYGRDLRRDDTESVPCAREIYTPQTPQTPQTAGQRLENLAGFSFWPKSLNPANPAVLRGLRVVRFLLRGLIFAFPSSLFAGQQACCGLCGLCGVTFGLLYVRAREGRA
jgi:hypothetical protein